MSKPPSIELPQLGYTFRQPELLTQALTHPSFTRSPEAAEANYQRLEFLGDAVLSLVLAESLYHTYPHEREGMLAQARAALAKGSTLSGLARDIGLHHELLLGPSEHKLKNRGLRSALEDAFEALIGAIYLDGGLEPARAFIHRAFGDFREAVARALEQDNPKGRLQERIQASDPEHPPLYNVVAEHGPDHAKTFEVEVTVFGVVSGHGSGRTKKEAEENAALAALDALDT